MRGVAIMCPDSEFCEPSSAFLFCSCFVVLYRFRFCFLDKATCGMPFFYAAV